MANQSKIQYQLQHPDLYFYDLSAVDGDVSGMFQANEIGSFSVSREEFLAAAEYCGYIADFDEKRTGKVFIPDEYEGCEVKANDWIEQTVEFDDRAAQEILKRVYQSKLEAEFREINRALNVREVTAKQVDASKDESFCEAILSLAQIIRTLNPDWIEYREVKVQPA